MTGWIASAVEAIVRGAGPMTVVTPIDLLDRKFGDDLLRRFPDRASFNPVRTARATVYIDIKDQIRNLIWDKEFFRRLLLFLSITEIDNQFDRRIAFREAVYDLAALLIFQEGHLETSMHFATKRAAFPGYFREEDWQRIIRDYQILSGRTDAWILTNISRTFVYLQERAHCEAAFEPASFQPVRDTVLEWQGFSKEILCEAIAASDPGGGDLMHDFALAYLTQLNLNSFRAFDELDAAFCGKGNMDELSCDYLAIWDLLKSFPLSGSVDFCRVFSAVIVTWQIYDYINTLREMFSCLSWGIEDASIEYKHGGVRNFLRSLMLLGEWRRIVPNSYDLDACEIRVLKQFERVSATFVEGASWELEQINQMFMFSGEFWSARRRRESEMTKERADKLFQYLLEYFFSPIQQNCHRGR
jgi:hypothetical protein